MNNVYFGDLEGKVWQVARQGRLGRAHRVFDAAANYLPANVGQLSDRERPRALPAIRRHRTSTPLGVTGSADWVPSTTLSEVFKVDLHGLASTPTTDTWSTVATLGTGERVYAVPTISGNNAYFITSLGGLQSAHRRLFTASGNLMRVDLGNTPG